MKVLVFGATGFIGHPVALALSRAGHDVVGVTRSAESAKKLESEEIAPLVADPQNVAAWIEAIKDVDAVIDAVGGDDIAKVAHAILDAVIAEAKKTRPHGPPLSYVYCGGTWVHGDDNRTLHSDRTPINNPKGITAWRMEVERKAVSAISKSFTANVVRPAMLYGTSGSLFGMLLFPTAKGGHIVWNGTPDTRMATIHQEDLAEAFRLVVEKSYSIPGVVFDIANNYPESITDILKELQVASGAAEISYKEPDNPFLKAVNSSNVLRPTLARSLLGWEPRKPPLSQGMKAYYRAWLASQA